MIISTKKAVGTAHGKIILIGEHAVVHNQPAIAIPFSSAKVAVEIERISGEVMIDSLYYQGPLAEAPDRLNNLKETLQAFASDFDQEIENLKIHIDSNIPSERGMGSSAAVATALVRALFQYFDIPLTNELLEKFVTISEKIAHGNPSGIDAQVVGSEKAVYFVRDQETDYFDAKLPGFLVIADTGQEGETIEAVNDVGKLLADEKNPANDWVEELGQLTLAAYNKIKAKQPKELGQILSKAQALLKKLTVSNQILDHLVHTAMDHGALGAKLTGGGRGGCMIALAEKQSEAEKIAHALSDAGAVKTWIHPLGNQ